MAWRAATLTTTALLLSASVGFHHCPTTSPRTAKLLATLEQESPPVLSFSEQVGRKMTQTFGEEACGRVLRSWQGTASGRSFSKELGPHRLMRQEARSYVEGLTAKPFWDLKGVDWAKRLARNWRVVRDEFEEVALVQRAKLEQEGSNVWVASRDADAGETYGSDWRTLGLYDRGRWDAQNAVLFPKTAQLLEDSGAPMVEAFFASMKPHSVIKPHSDHCNFLMTSHLPLIVPGHALPEPPCRLSVGDETRAWQEGQLLLFDTSILHDAMNDSDEHRYILMLRIFHPDLSAVERQALQFLFDCLESPGLASDDPDELRQAQAQVLAQRAPLSQVLTGTISSDASGNKPATPTLQPTQKRRKASAGFGAAGGASAAKKTKKGGSKKK